MAWIRLALAGLGLVVAVSLLLLLAVFVCFACHLDYWGRKRVSRTKPVNFVRNLWTVVTGKVPTVKLMEEMYVLFKPKGYGGVFSPGEPVLMVCEPEMIKQMLTKDFSSLVDHGVAVDEREPFSGNLFNLNGDTWRHLRYKLAPVFTSGKLKLMYPLIKECVGELISALRQELKLSDSIDIRDFLTRSATDVIGTCAFGLQCNSVKDPKSEFHVMSRKIFKPNFFGILKAVLFAINVKLSRLVPNSLVSPGVTEFFVNLMRDTIEYRKKNGIVRNDFVNLLMEIKAKDDKAKAEGQEITMELTDSIMAAQGFIFFLAGLDNISNTIGLCLHELAVNPDIQDRLVQDVDSAVRNHEGELTYDAVREMSYLNQVIDETLRKYTSGSAILMREVTAPEYKVPGTDVILEKKTKVLIPMSAIHADADIYPEPERFDPERFTEEAKSLRHPYSFLPFGEGPRFCIAQRFAILEMKVCVAALVREFQFSPCAKTSVPIKLNPRMFATPLDGIWLKLEERDKTN